MSTFPIPLSGARECATSFVTSCSFLLLYDGMGGQMMSENAGGMGCSSDASSVHLHPRDGYGWSVARLALASLPGHYYKGRKHGRGRPEGA